MRFKALTAGLLLAMGSTGANAAISRFVNGELFLELYDSTAQKSYTMDLGGSFGTLPQMLANPASANQSITLDWSGITDKNGATAVAPTPGSNWLWTVKASNDDAYAYFVNGGTDPVNDPTNYTGFLTTLRTGSVINTTNASIGSIIDPLGYLTSHVAVVNSPSNNNSLNVNKAFSVGDEAYYTTQWDGKMGSTIAIFTDQQVGASGSTMPMYFVTYADFDNLGPAIGHGGQSLGTWSFNGSQLSFTATSTPVPVPAAVWLFGSALTGLVTIARRGRTSA